MALQYFSTIYFFSRHLKETGIKLPMEQNYRLLLFIKNTLFHLISVFLTVKKALFHQPGHII